MENLISDVAVERVMQTLELLAGKIGKTVQEMFAIYTKGAAISGRAEFIAILLGLIMTSLLIWLTYLVFIRNLKKMNKMECSYSDMPFAIAALTFILGIVFITALCIGLYDLIMATYAPEYIALQNMFRDIGMLLP